MDSESEEEASYILNDSEENQLSTFEKIGVKIKRVIEINVKIIYFQYSNTLYLKPYHINSCVL